MVERRKAILCLCHDSKMLLIRRMLLEHFGFLVLTTTSEEDAKKIAEQQCPDMLLMDNGEPGMDYRGLAEHVKKICPTVITVVLSPHYRFSSGDAMHSIDCFVAKDDGPDALLAEIRKLLGGPQQHNLPPELRTWPSPADPEKG